MSRLQGDWPAGIRGRGWGKGPINQGQPGRNGGKRFEVWPIRSGIGIAEVFCRSSPLKGDFIVPAADTLWDWNQVIRSEYLEMPGLSLTKPQARRLWGLDQDTCNALIDSMVAAKFLRRTSRDCYVRNDDRSLAS